MLAQQGGEQQGQVEDGISEQVPGVARRRLDIVQAVGDPGVGGVARSVLVWTCSACVFDDVLASLSFSLPPVCQPCFRKRSRAAASTVARLGSHSADPWGSAISPSWSDSDEVGTRASAGLDTSDR
jgi:hypothetical protein